MGQPGREALVVCSDESMKIGITVWDVDTGDEILKIPSCAASPYGFLCLRNQCLAASLVNRHGSLGGGAIFMWALNKVRASDSLFLVTMVLIFDTCSTFFFFTFHAGCVCIIFIVG